MIFRFLFITLLLASITVAASTPAGRVVKTINRDWTFQYFSAPEPDLAPAQASYDDSRWPAISLPHTWSTYETTGDVHPFIRSASERDDSYWWYGWGWYHKRFSIAHQYEDRLVAVEFDGIQKYSRIYLNGQFVGEHQGGYTSFSVDITTKVRFDAPNVLAVEVSNRRDDPFGGIPPMTAGNFDVYGGIYRDFILPAYWCAPYLGQRKPIVVDSNCDQVVLKVNGETRSSERPSASNNHTVTFENVEVRRGTLTVEGHKGVESVTYSLPMAGASARLLLKSSAEQIVADRARIAVLSADIVDSSGVHVYGANPQLTWLVSGPATLVGPAVCETDTAKDGAREGTMYIDMPVSNLVRSTARPGTIRVSVSAPGPEPAGTTLVSLAPADDRVEGISELPLTDQGRLRVARMARFQGATRSSLQNTIAEIDKDYDFAVNSPKEVRAELESFVKRRNPRLDVSTAAYRAFIDRMTEMVIERNGKLIADDYNFAARAYSNRAPVDARGNERRRRIRSTLLVPEPLPNLETESYGQFEPASGVIAERVSYATGYGLRVPAIVYRPKNRPNGRMPGIVVVNGHGGDKYSWYSFYTGILYAQAGAAVVTYDPIGEGERNIERKDGTRQHDRYVDPPEMARRLSGLMITDVMQAVSYLAARPDVDAQRIAAVGYSMGSFVLALDCAVDLRLNSCVLVGGGNLDKPGGYWDSSTKKMCQAIPYQSLQFLGDRGAEIYSLHAERGATLIINGSADDVVAIPEMGRPFFEDLRKRTIALHGDDRNVFDFVMVPGAGHRPYFITRPAALWLERHLAFPNWTMKSIAEMPETHIMDWAKQNHVTIDKLYATALREGGTRALGVGIPAVPHGLMNALPLERWQQEKGKYVYETWLQNAQALLQTPP